MEYIIIIFLILLSALFSGLTLGFFSLDKGNLKRKAELGDARAKKVYKIRKNGNLLLCTLLIGNVAVNSTLSIFLGSIISGVVAGFIATGLIVIFGEIIPQAAFSRYALETGSRLTWLVKFFIIIFYPICRPISFFLDMALGNEMPTVYSRYELMKIVEEHGDLKESDIDEDEEKIIKGALSFSDKVARDIMTPRSEIFALSTDEKLTKALIQKIYKAGHSRIPVYEDELDNIIGILFIKDLIAENYVGKEVRDLMDSELLFVDQKKRLDDLLNSFRKKKIHLAVVMNEYDAVAGIVTIEDVIEEIIGVEIVDEFDKYENLQKLAKAKGRKKNRNKT